MTNYTKPHLIKLIHIGKSKLGMDEDTYRAMLLQIGNASSTTEMGISKLEAVLEHLKRCGFKVVPNKAGRLKRADDAQSKKIRSLWLELHALGEVNDPSEYALSRYVKRITKVDNLNWINSVQASTVIETLKKWLGRIKNETE